MANQSVNGSNAAVAVLLLAPIAVWMAISARFCPDIAPKHYSVSASDINGKLEYCIGRHSFGGRGYPEMAIIAPGATCGPDKAKLVAEAEAMTQKSASEVQACQNRSTAESVAELYHRWFGR